MAHYHQEALPPAFVETVDASNTQYQPDIDQLVDEPFQTIMITVHGARQMIDVSFRQYMQLPELHSGSEVEGNETELRKKLATMGLIEMEKPRVSTTRQVGQKETYNNPGATPFNEAELAARQRLALKFAARR